MVEWMSLTLNQVNPPTVTTISSVGKAFPTWQSDLVLDADGETGEGRGQAP